MSTVGAGAARPFLRGIVRGRALIVLWALLLPRPGALSAQSRGVADIHATEQAELARITRWRGDSVRVEIFRLDARGRPGARPFFWRTFPAEESAEVRVYLHGGDDRAEVRGWGGGRPVVRVIGGPGDDVLEDATEGGSGAVHFYDARGQDTIVARPGTDVDRSAARFPGAEFLATHPSLPRDWGSRVVPSLVAAWDPDAGLLLGGSVTRFGYDFRKLPHESRVDVTLGVRSKAGQLQGSLFGERMLASGSLWLRGAATVYGVSTGRFFGFGNDTRGAGPDADRFRAFREEVSLEAHIEYRPAPGVGISAGPAYRRWEPFEEEGTLVADEAPYGFGIFEEVGVTARLFVDRTDRPLAARRGGYLLLRGAVFPEALDALESFGRLSGEVAGYLSREWPTRPTLALRLGGERVWGRFPYPEAALLGGGETLRGFREARFAGDASVWANAELRVSMLPTDLLFRGTLGLHGLADTGRVFLDGASPGGWHSALGGGVWLAMGPGGNVVTLSIADSSEGTELYFRAGFAF